MTSPSTETRLDVTRLLDRPGASRRIDLTPPVPDDLDWVVAEPVGNVRLQGIVESVVEGLLVRAALRARLRLACSRCLAGTEGEVVTEVVELYTDPTRDAGGEAEPGYAIEDGTLELSALVRDALVPAVPYRPLCRGDCQGLCPSCGTDRNVERCECSDDEPDPRWSALQQLRLPADGE